LTADMVISGTPRVAGGPPAETVLALVRGFVGAVAPDGRHVGPVQRSVVRAITKAMTGFDVDPDAVEPLGADELAVALADRDDQFRARIVQVMVLGELVLHPIPPDVATRVEAYANALGVHENLVRVARRYAAGNLGLAAFDLRRTGYLERWSADNAELLHTKRPLDDPFDVACDDPALYERWRAFERYDPDSLGHRVWRFYRDRGFVFPGRPDSAAPYLAQHDFVHVLADYPTTLQGEFEVFGLIGRSDPDLRGFTWIATIIGLFDTGYHDAQGLFRMDVRERWLEQPGVDVRLADAMYRGARCGKDLLAIDYHSIADQDVSDVRELLGIVPKSAEAIEAGSVSPFADDPDAMSSFQREAGLRLAAGAETAS
jgi:hypothetical protein